MFYDTSPFMGENSGGKRVAALAMLTSSESKRLIGKAVAALPEVRRALEVGTVIITRGTTNAFVAEEVMRTPVSKERFTSGFIAAGGLGVTPQGRRLRPFILQKGQVVEMRPTDALQQFGAEDVFIKGANAVDPQGNAGVLMFGDGGGTIGGALSILVARGSSLIVPVGLEKLIPSVLEALAKCGLFRLQPLLERPAGLMPLVTAQVVTEVEALAVLTGVKATPVSAGGIGGAEGSLTLVLEGDEKAMQQATSLIQGIKGEPPVADPMAQTGATS